MEFVTFKNDFAGRDASSRVGVVLSVGFHCLVVCALLFSFGRALTSEIVAAGPGEGGEGGGGSIEVGVADKSAILGFAKPQPISQVGDTDDAINNARLERENKVNLNDEALLPPTEHDIPDPKALKTDRPVANQQEKIFTGKEERGRSTTQTAQVGRTFGSPTPQMVGGIGLGTGGGSGGGTGLPGGSEYGRRIQAILSRNYTTAQIDSGGIEYIKILIRISRDGRILSLSGGRVAQAYFKVRSSNAQANNAAERAILASDPLPPFPSGFLSGVHEATAEVWFRYPK